MALLFIDGFPFSIYDAVPLKYNLLSASFDQGQLIAGPGPGDVAVWTFNTAFGSTGLQKIFNPNGKWFVGRVYEPLNSGLVQTWTQMDFMKLGDHMGDMCWLRQNTDGTMSFWAENGLGTPHNYGQLGSGTPFVPDVFAVGTQRYLEIAVTVGTHGECSVYVDGVRRFHAINIAIGDDILRPSIDRVTPHFFQNFGGTGPVIGSLYICDGEPGAPFDGVLGPCRVMGMVPKHLFTNVGFAPVGNTDPVYCVSDRNPWPGGQTYPDGDFAYMNPTTANAAADYNLDTSTAPCVGKILAVAINAVVRPTDQDPTRNTVYSGSSQFSFTVGGGTVGPLQNLTASGDTLTLFESFLYGYRTYQFIMLVPPGLSPEWTDALLGSLAFGFQANGTKLHVTQLYIEKLVTLAPVPFDCGAGNYSF